MKVRSRRAIVGALGTTLVCLLGVAFAGGQAAPQQKPLMSEDVFKNVQVLRGITVNQFMETMGFFSASLGANCTYCHVAESGGSWAKYADDNDHKQMARKMIVMVNAMNQTYFGGRRVLTCYSCHRFGNRPKIIPNLAEQYGTPPPDEPDEILKQAAGVPTANQVLDKYIQAIGGAQRVASLTSFIAKGTYQGYEDTEKHPLEIYAKAPNQRATILHSPGGDSTTTFDGRAGWVAAPDTDVPVPVLPLTGADLDAAKVDADLTFPGHIKQAFSDWRVGFASLIGDREVQVVQGTTTGRLPVKLYFDSESGLLVRVLRYTELPLGRIPTQIDYSDYRDVGGIKMPFRWTLTWVDGRSITELSEIRPNVAVDAAKFGKPATPTPPPATKAAAR